MKSHLEENVAHKPKMMFIDWGSTSPLASLGAGAPPGLQGWWHYALCKDVRPPTPQTHTCTQDPHPVPWGVAVGCRCILGSCMHVIVHLWFVFLFPLPACSSLTVCWTLPLSLLLFCLWSCLSTVSYVFSNQEFCHCLESSWKPELCHHHRRIP